MGSSAVTLGRHSGVALIGRPLDVRLQVMLAPGEDIGTQCVAAEVFYGDVLVPSNLVTVTTSIAAGETTGTARVVSSQPINEPIVTLSVRAGCGLPFTRRYVLLADPVSEPASTQPLPAPAAVAPAPAPLPVPAPQAAPAAAAVPAPPPTAAPAPAPVVRARPPAPPKPPKVAVAPRPKQSAPAPAPAPKVANAPAGAAAAPAAGGSSRLRLDPPDLPASGAGSPGGQAPAGSAAGSPAEPNALETALAAANAEVARNNERLAALEAEMARFREAQQRDQARVAELTAQLARAEEDRYSNWVVFLLGGLLALALAAIAVLMRRQRRETALASDASRAWWAEQPADEADEPPTRASRRAALEPSAPVPLDEIDVDVDSAPVPLPPPAMPRKAASDSLPPIDRREFAPSAMGVSRSVATEELFDVQQQADFFVSLGEDEQAIAVLRNHLAESHEPSPLAYLDLFRLYHRLGRREDYDALREEFNTVFNAGAPQFDRYSDKGRGLEAYETAFARIQALWPQPRVLDLIERSIFRDSQEGETEVFDLEAYRELLMLHAIAKELVERDAGSTQPPRDFQNTNMQPLKAAGKAEAASAPAGAGEETQRRNVTVPMDLHVIPPASPRVALDVNIEELEIESQFEASLPEVDVPVEPTAGRSRAFREGESMIDFEILDNIPPVQRRDSDRNGGSSDDPAR